MDDSDRKHKLSTTLTYKNVDPAVVFRIAWYVAGSNPGMLLDNYSEAESKDFQGSAAFSGEIEDEKTNIQISVEGVKQSIELTASSDDEKKLKTYLDGMSQFINASLSKYLELEEDEQSRLRRALVAKTCWDRIVHHILNKETVSNIYFQVAHGREMMIKATEGDDIHPITLSTSGWLTRIESLERDELMPSNIATELAKKSIEWKRETQSFIEQYLAIHL